MTIHVNEQTIRRGHVSLHIPAIDDTWEDYRFRCINSEYPARAFRDGVQPAKARLVAELSLETQLSNEMGKVA